MTTRDVYAERRTLAIADMVRTALDGARNIWAWQSGFNTPGATPPDPVLNVYDRLRADFFDFVLSLNADITAMGGQRNRPHRAGQVSFSYLTVNPQ